MAPPCALEATGAAIIARLGSTVAARIEITSLETLAALSSVRRVEAARLYEPSVLAGYLLELARALHASYRNLRVKGEEEKKAKARLLLFTVVKSVLASGLRILGIRPLEKM